MRAIVAVLLLTFGGLAQAQIPTTYVGGETDTTTPQVRIVLPRWKVTAREKFTVRLKFSTDFDYCAMCAADLPIGYLQTGQIPQQGHAHAYMQKIYSDGEFRPNVPTQFIDSSFCALNRLNPTTEVGPDFVTGDCLAPSEPGWYRICATLEQDAHGNRNKHHPRAFPSVDCKSIWVSKKRSGPH